MNRAVERRLRVAILTTGRFHVCDLARELSARGHDVAFYSLVPPWRTAKFGLPFACNRWLLPAVMPQWVFARRAVNTPVEGFARRAFVAAFGAVAARVIQRCDVFIGMSGLSSQAALAARRKFGARILIERGSRHILSQKKILEAVAGAAGRRTAVPRDDVERELHDYAIADAIVVPARHVVRSFVEYGVPRERQFRNPYGVDVERFSPCGQVLHAKNRILTVGRWSLRKGSDVLAAAWRRVHGATLVHVGEIGDCPVPTEDGFAHVDAVDQHALPGHYRCAHVFALASREEGLALVQLQALACGVPIVCTDRTGGEDLLDLLQLEGAVTCVPSEDERAMAAAVENVLASATRMDLQRELTPVVRERLSWRAYGERYDRFLREVA